MFLNNALNQSQRRHITIGHTRFLQIFTKLSITNSHTQCYKLYNRRSQLLRGLRCGSAADGLLEFRVRIPPGAGTFVSFKWCVLGGTALSIGLITHPEKSYRLWCPVSVIAKPGKGRPLPGIGSKRHRGKNLHNSRY